jgi:hypothetical protein
MPADQSIQAHNVYRDQLTALSHGLALWDPNPPKHIYNNVSIGDVGYLNKGTFIRMFNVMLPWDDLSNRTLGQPEFYESLDLGPFANTIRRRLNKSDHYYSRNVTYVSADTNVKHMDAMTSDE